MSNEKKTDNLKRLSKVVLPIIRKVFPDIVAKDLVGVQPMDAPASQAFTLRTKYDHRTHREIIWDTVHEIEAEKIKAEKEQDSKI